MASFCHSPPLSPQEPCHWTFYSAVVCIKPAELNTSVRLSPKEVYVAHSFTSQRFYANEMLMHWCILHFAPKAVQICKTNLFKFTEKGTMNIKLQIFKARENVSMLSARPEYVAQGDPSCPPKRVNLWHYWLSDMKRIHKSGVVRLWMGMGFWHCEQDPFRQKKKKKKCEAVLKQSHVLV